MGIRLALPLVVAATMIPGAVQAKYTNEAPTASVEADPSVPQPVRAIINVVVGATRGASDLVAEAVLAPPPPPVITYVQREDVPSVTIEKEVVVGQPLPPQVKVYVVPDHRGYAYTVINRQRVIVNPRTRRVIEIIGNDDD